MSTAAPSAASVYAKELCSAGNGLPLWHPERRVAIGDVGFIQEDVFVRLFNATLPADDSSQSSALPEGYEPLKIPDRFIDPHPSQPMQKHWGPVMLCSKSVRKLEIQFELTAGASIPLSSGCTFRCENTLGAILIAKKNVYRKTVLDHWDARHYIKKHIDSWYALTERLGYLDPADGFLFIRGCDWTAEWAVAAFKERRRDASIFFNGGYLSVAGVNVALSGSWRFETPAESRSGPDHRPASPTPSSSRHRIASIGRESRNRDLFTGGSSNGRSDQPDCLTIPDESSNQCLFIRSWKARRRPLRLPPYIKAAAESDQSDDLPSSPNMSSECLGATGDADEDSMSVDLDPAVSPSYHPLDAVLDYILSNSLANVAIGSDDDLLLLCDEAGLCDDDIAGALQRVRPRVCTDNAGAAMLSSQTVTMSSQAAMMPSRLPGSSPKDDLLDYHKLSPGTRSETRVTEVDYAARDVITTHPTSTDRFTSMVAHEQPQPGVFADAEPDSSVSLDMQRLRGSVSKEGFPAELLKLSAYDADDPRLVASVRRILGSNEEKARIEREERRAQDLMDWMQLVLDSIEPHHILFPLRSPWRRLLCNLSKNSGQVPTSLHLADVRYNPTVAQTGGGNSDVFIGMYQGQKVCVKRLRVFKYGAEKEIIIRGLCREAMTSHQLKHPHLLSLLGINDESTSQGVFLSLVSPWMERGSLNRFQHTTKLTAGEINKLLFQVSEAIEYLHGEDIVHGDIRAANVLVDDMGCAQLTDFGLTVVSDATAGVHSVTGSTTRWTAPELLCPEEFGIVEYQRTKASDVFAFGMTCVEAYTMKHPFDGTTSDGSVILKIVRGLRPSRPNDADCPGRIFSDDLWSLTTRCWQEKFTARPDMYLVREELEHIASP